MSDFTRGNTFVTDQKVTPADLNALVENATLTNVSLAELGTSFKSIFYSDTDPGASGGGKLWYDTTAGQTGFKYAFCTPSNASVCGWLYASPYREAYYWANTSVSLGSPLFIGRANDVESQLAMHLYDGAAFIKAYLPLGSTNATEANAPLVITTEARVGAGPVRAAWAGLMPFDTFASNVSQHSPLFIDHHNALKFTSVVDNPSTLLNDVVSYWHLDGASGVTRSDSIGTNHLDDTGAVKLASTTGKIDTAPDYNGNTSEKLRAPDSASLDLTGDFTITCWVKFNALASQRSIVSKWNNADTGRSYKIAYGAGADRIFFAVTSDGTAGTQTSLNADTFGAPSTGTWYFIAVQHDATSELIRISINGGAWDSTAHTGDVFSGASAFVLGLDENNVNPLDGQVDEVAIFSRLITDAEVAQIYNSGAAQRLDTHVNQATLARSSIYGTVLSNLSQPTPNAGRPVGVLWGTGPVIQDVNQT